MSNNERDELYDQRARTVLKEAFAEIARLRKEQVSGYEGENPRVVELAEIIAGGDPLVWMEDSQSALEDCVSLSWGQPMPRWWWYVDAARDILEWMEMQGEKNSPPKSAVDYMAIVREVSKS